METSVPFSWLLSTCYPLEEFGCGWHLCNFITVPVGLCFYILLHLFVIIVFSSLHIRAQVSIIHSCHSPTPDSLTFLNVRYNYMVTSIAFNAWYFLSFELCLLLLCSYFPAYLLAHWILLTVSQCSESVNYFYESFKIIINTSSEIHSMAGKYINKQCVCVWGGAHLSASGPPLVWACLGKIQEEVCLNRCISLKIWEEAGGLLWTPCRCWAECISEANK